MVLKILPELRIRTVTTFERSQKFVHIRRNRGELHRLLPFLKGFHGLAVRLSKTESEFFKTETEWIGHKIDQAGIRQLQDKLLAIKK